MSADIGLPLRPEEEELKLKEQELRDLENRLVERELRLATLKGELTAFETAYRKRVGVLYVQLDEVDAQIAELVAARDSDDMKAQAHAREARTRAEESRAEVAEVPVKQLTQFAPSESIKSLYREVAKRIHPDLAINDADRARRQKLMAQANQAYEGGDAGRLRAILAQYESSPDAVVGEGTGVDLVRIIRKIAQSKRRLAEIDSETERLVASELVELKKRVDEGIRNDRDVLEEIVCAVQSQIQQQQKELQNLRVSVKQ